VQTLDEAVLGRAELHDSPAESNDMDRVSEDAAVQAMALEAAWLQIEGLMAGQLCDYVDWGQVFERLQSNGPWPDQFLHPEGCHAVLARMDEAAAATPAVGDADVIYMVERDGLMQRISALFARVNEMLEDMHLAMIEVREQQPGRRPAPSTLPRRQTARSLSTPARVKSYVSSKLEVEREKRATKRDEDRLGEAVLVGMGQGHGDEKMGGDGQKTETIKRDQVKHQAALVESVVALVVHRAVEDMATLLAKMG